MQQRAFGYEQQTEIEVPHTGVNTYQLGEHTVTAGNGQVQVTGRPAYYGVMGSHMVDEEHTDDGGTMEVEPGTYRIGIDNSGPGRV